MGFPGIDMKVRRPIRSFSFVCLLSLALMVAGCKGDSSEVQEGEEVNAVPTGRVISGEEALRLYGIEPWTEVGTEEPNSTSEPWFPMQVWVSASVLPYDDPDPIVVLPVYADNELGVSSTWVGDLEAGSAVMLLSVDADGRACFIEGQALQGWEVRGWVACNRLLFEEPTPVGD